MISTVIFDFDLTLADSIEAITNGVNALAGHFGLPPKNQTQVMAAMSLAGADFWRSLWGRYDEPWDEFFRRATSSSSSSGRIGLRPMPEAEQLLADLRNRGILIGLATNRSIAWAALAAVNLARYFDTAVGAADVPKSKPAPDMLITALKQTGSQASQSFFIGDAACDMEAAAAAGMRGIGLLTGAYSAETLYRAGAWQVRDSLKNIRDLLNIQG